MPFTRTVDVQKRTEDIGELPRAVWIERRKQRLDREQARKQRRHAGIKDNDHSDVAGNGNNDKYSADKYNADKYNTDKYNKYSANTNSKETPSQPTSTPSPHQPLLQKPTFNKILYYILTALFFFPGYLYKKNYKASFQRYLNQKKKIEKKPMIKNNPQPDTKKNIQSSFTRLFTPDELEYIYARTDDTDVPSHPNPPHEIDTEKEPPQTHGFSSRFSSLFSCFPCFFNKPPAPSLSQGKSNDFNSRLSRR